MKKAATFCGFFCLCFFPLTLSAWANGQIIIDITGNCKRVKVSNVVEADVILNGNFYKERVSGIAIYVPAGTHTLQVNGYCVDQEKNVAHNLGVWRETVKIKTGEKKRYTARFK